MYKGCIRDRYRLGRQPVNSSILSGRVGSLYSQATARPVTCTLAPNGSFGYPGCTSHQGRAVPLLKGNTEKVARAVEQEVNFGALRGAGPIQEHSADNLVPREPGSTYLGCHNGKPVLIGGWKGVQPGTTKVPKYSSGYTVKIVRGLKAECKMRPLCVQQQRGLNSMLLGEPPHDLVWPTEVTEVPRSISPYLV